MTAGGGTLWVIDPSQRRPEHEGVRAVAAGWPGEVRISRPALVAGDGPFPQDGYDVAAVVVMGSAASPVDEFPWLQRLSAWLTPIVRGEVVVPTLGICFGHQLIAHCAGGEVGFVHPDKSKLTGAGRSMLDDSRLLPGVESLQVVISHREEVRRAPDAYRVCAHREAVAIDALEHRTHPIFSFQFHPEAGQEFVRNAGISSDVLDERQVADSRRLLDAFRRQASGDAA